MEKFRDIKRSDSTMFNLIFWKKVQGQTHPGRWEIAERKTPSVKMLFKTYTNGHKHHCIRLFIIKQDTIGEDKKTKQQVAFNTGTTHSQKTVL